MSRKNNKKWKTVIDFTKIRKGGVEINELIQRLNRLLGKPGKATKQ